MQNDPNYPIRKYIRLRGYDYSNTGFYFITIVIQKRLCLFGNIVDGNMILNDAGRMVEKWYYELENKFPNTRCHEMVVMPDHFHCIIENVLSPRPIMKTDKIQTDEIQTVAHVGAPLRGRPLSNDERGQPFSNDECRRPLSNDERGQPFSNDECRQPLANDECGRPLSNDECGQPFSNDECRQPFSNDECRQPLANDECGCPLSNDECGRPLSNDEHKHPKTNYGIDNKKTNATIGDAVRWFKTMTTNEYIRGVKQNGWQRFDGILWQRNFFDHIIRNEESYIEKTEYIINNPQNWRNNFDDNIENGND